MTDRYDMERPADYGDRGDWGRQGSWGTYGNRPDYNRGNDWREGRGRFEADWGGYDAPGARGAPSTHTRNKGT